MSDLLSTVLFSLDYRSVDEPVFSALELYEKMYKGSDTMPISVFKTLRRVQSSNDLALKRALWLLMLVCCKPIMDYTTTTTTDPERMKKFLDWLVLEFGKLFQGDYSLFDDQLIEFVTQAQMLYNS